MSGFPHNPIQLDQSQDNTYVIVMNHLITNKIDAFHFFVIFVFIFVLYSYQCTKINNYARGNNKHIQFQVLFYILTLVRIMELSYSYLGYEIDQQSNEWLKKGKKLIYCDPSLEYDMKGYCYERYEIIGIFQNINLYLGIIAIQMITFFWQKQISPLMFLSIYKVLMNQYVPQLTKIVYLFFIIIDIVMLGCQFCVWLVRYDNKAFNILHIFQLIFASLTGLNFLYNIYKQHMNGENLFRNNYVKVYCIATFIVARTGYIVLRSFFFDRHEVMENFKKTDYQSAIYFVFNILECLSRVFVIKLF